MHNKNREKLVLELIVFEFEAPVSVPQIRIKLFNEEVSEIREKVFIDSLIFETLRAIQRRVGTKRDIVLKEFKLNLFALLQSRFAITCQLIEIFVTLN